MKHFLARFYSFLFNNEAIRKKVIFYLKMNYFHEFDFTLDLGWGFRSPLYSSEARCSFSEIFFQDEYDTVFAEIKLPTRWLDLGCHYGFFSLYVAWLRAREGDVSPVAALLVDADSRVSPGVERLINLNELGSQFKYLYGAISEGNGQVDFVEQDFMSSSLDRLVADNAGSAIKEVPIIDQNVILSTLPPPYDLIKIDIEGGEYDFLMGYEQVLKNANILLVEWHSWHRGGGSGKQIQHIAESYGFYLKKIVQDPKSCGEPGSNREVGVFLFSKD